MLPPPRTRPCAALCAALFIAAALPAATAKNEALQDVMSQTCSSALAKGSTCWLKKDFSVAFDFTRSIISGQETILTPDANATVLEATKLQLVAAYGLDVADVADMSRVTLDYNDGEHYALEILEYPTNSVKFRGGTVSTSGELGWTLSYYTRVGDNSSAYSTVMSGTLKVTENDDTAYAVSLVVGDGVPCDLCDVSYWYPVNGFGGNRYGQALSRGTEFVLGRVTAETLSAQISDLASRIATMRQAASDNADNLRKLQEQRASKTANTERGMEF